MDILTKNQSDALESFRGISAILVVICHFFQVFLARFYPEYYPIDLMIAHSSVMIFFVMSGYLIGISIKNNISRNGCFVLSKFAKSRFSRIYPPLIFASLLCVFLFIISPMFFESGTSGFLSADPFIKGKSLTVTAKELLSSLTFTNGFMPISVRFNSPLWSLPYEVWYYVIFGILATRKLGLVFVALFLFILLSLSNDRFLAYSIVWGAGFLFSFITRIRKHTKIFVLIGLFVFGVNSILTGNVYLDLPRDLEPYKISFGLFFAFVLLLMKIYDIRFSILKFTARFSYTLYISHFPIMLFFIGAFESSVISKPSHSLLIGMTSVVSAILISYFSSLIFENKKIISKLI